MAGSPKETESNDAGSNKKQKTILIALIVIAVAVIIALILYFVKFSVSSGPAGSDKAAPSGSTLHSSEDPKIHLVDPNQEKITNSAFNLHH